MSSWGLICSRRMLALRVTGWIAAFFLRLAMALILSVCKPDKIMLGRRVRSSVRAAARLDEDIVMD